MSEKRHLIVLALETILWFVMFILFCYMLFNFTFNKYDLNGDGKIDDLDIQNIQEYIGRE